MNALGRQQIVDIVDVVFHDLIDVGQIRHRFSCFVDDEARASFIREVFNTLG